MRNPLVGREIAPDCAMLARRPASGSVEAHHEPGAHRETALDESAPADRDPRGLGGSHHAPPFLICGGAMDARADPLVGPAPADVARHGVVDVVVTSGWALAREQRRRRHDLPGLAVAALGNVQLDPGLLHRMIALARTRPSMVVIFFPATALTGVVQERTGWPSTCTVQAPHSAMPQPYLVPVSVSFSRITHSKGMSAGASTWLRLPLTIRVTMESS